jgi:hypothetical protein
MVIASLVISDSGDLWAHATLIGMAEGVETALVRSAAQSGLHAAHDEYMEAIRQLSEQQEPAQRAELLFLAREEADFTSYTPSEFTMRVVSNWEDVPSAERTANGS